jgi:hypothetical protein
VKTRHITAVSSVRFVLHFRICHLRAVCTSPALPSALALPRQTRAPPPTKTKETGASAAQHQGEQRGRGGRSRAWQTAAWSPPGRSSSTPARSTRGVAVALCALAAAQPACCSLASRQWRCRRPAGALPPAAMSRQRRWLVLGAPPRPPRAEGREVASLGSQSRPRGRTPGLRRRNSAPGAFSRAHAAACCCRVGGSRPPDPAPGGRDRAANGQKQGLLASSRRGATGKADLVALLAPGKRGGLPCHRPTPALPCSNTGAPHPLPPCIARCRAL